MALLNVISHPDPRLTKVSREVPGVDDVVRRILDDMAETMYYRIGIGLAAPQVGHDMRAFVVDLHEGRGLRHFVNPEITFRDGSVEWREGCLSFPGTQLSVERAAIIRVRALGRDGKPFEFGAHGVLAAAIQHECDHLEGILISDRAEERNARINRRSKRKALRRARRS
jgi:peptide deformylase